MKIKGVYSKDNNKPDTVLSSNPAPLSTKQVKDEVRNAIANLKARGIKDWEILNTWSEIAHEQGNYAVADTLANAAYELGKPSE